MLHVEFKKWPCRYVEFSGPDPDDSYGKMQVFSMDTKQWNQWDEFQQFNW